MSSTASVGGSNSAFNYSTFRKIERLISRADQSASNQVSPSAFNSIGQNLPGSSATSSTSNSSTTDASGSTTSSTTTAVSAQNASSSQTGTIGGLQLVPDQLSLLQQIPTFQSVMLSLQEVFSGGSSSSSASGAAGSSGASGGRVGGASQGHHAMEASAADDVSTTSQTVASSSSTSSTWSSTATDPISAFFNAVDTNNDGSISKAELSSFVTQVFSRSGSSTQTGTGTTATNTTV